MTGRLGPLPVEALHGIGPRQAAALRDYGVHCLGLLAAVPPATVQRLLGGKVGRLAAVRARGVDPAPSSRAPCPPRRACATASRSTPWTAPPSAPLCWILSSGSAPGCAAAARPPAP
ncbi:hypothetical protein ABZ235_40120 [Streptomyces canus]|uniref:hypothetical protein n=1 Tax=Streptomyces canus TaxID=58343 RepID=UPI0033B12904